MDIREHLKERHPNAEVYPVTQVDMRAIDAFKYALPNGQTVNIRMMRDSRLNKEFIQYEEKAEALTNRDALLRKAFDSLTDASVSMVLAIDQTQPAEGEAHEFNESVREITRTLIGARDRLSLLHCRTSHT